MDKANAANRAWAGAIRAVLVLTAVAGGVWLYLERGRIREHFEAKERAEVYGIVWNTSLNTARRQAAESGREILLVHLDLQWKSHPHAAGLLALRVLDTEEFRRESGNYVLLLAARTPREPARIRRNREEISRIYNLGERDSGTLLLIDAAGKQLRRIPYRGEPAGELLRRLSEPEEGSSGNTVNQGGEKP